MRNRDLFLASEHQVAVNIGTGIKYRGDSRGIITEQIGKLGDALGLNGFKNECHKGSCYYDSWWGLSFKGAFFRSRRALPVAAYSTRIKTTRSLFSSSVSFNSSTRLKNSTVSSSVSNRSSCR